MGEYLSTPNKVKHSSEGSNLQVQQQLALIEFRFHTEPPVCKAGGDRTKMHT